MKFNKKQEEALAGFFNGESCKLIRGGHIVNPKEEQVEISEYYFEIGPNIWGVFHAVEGEQVQLYMLYDKEQFIEFMEKSKALEKGIKKGSLKEFDPTLSFQRKVQ